LKTARYSAIFMGLVSLIFLFGAEYIISFFTTEPAIAGYSVNALRIICCGYIFYGIGMVMINAFNGAGDTWTPTWINLGGFWAFQIPLAYLLAKTFELGPLGVFIAIPVAETAITIASVILFRRGKWKHIKI
jgi:Na+-driven multidrug efflux pump